MSPTLMETIYKLFRTGHNAAQSSRPDVGYPVSEDGKPFIPPVPSFYQGEWTCKQEAYKYPINQSLKDPWEKCNDVLKDSDGKLCKGLSDQIQSLLVVATLFLGIITAFAIESLKWIQVDPGEVTVARLDEVIRLLSDPSTQAAAQPRQVFVPDDRLVVVNQLWFLAMTLSLSAVVIGTLCLQWLSAFQRNVRNKPYDVIIALRQLRYEGLMAWGVPHVPALLLLTVQGSFILFAAGLLDLLWSVNERVALPVAIVSGVSIALFALTALMPLLQSLMGWVLPQTLAIPQCPYKSPISWLVHRFFILFAIIGSLPFSWPPPVKKKLSEWRLQQLKLLTDYLWHEYDELGRRQRESWGPQKGSNGYSYYLVRGLAFAVERLVFHPEDVHTIHACLQDFHGTRAEVDTFEKLFSKYTYFSRAEGELLRDGLVSSAAAGGHHPPSAQVHLDNLRRDFLNAHALQHFVAHNQKLHRTLLPHRVELYIRVKNSSRVLKEEKRCIGGSIECPVRSLRDAQGLSRELRIQFLRCADGFLGTKYFKKEDNDGTRFVAEASEDLGYDSGLTHANSEPPNDGNYEKVVTVPLKRPSTLDESEGTPDTTFVTEEPTSIMSPDWRTPVCSQETQDDHRANSSTLGPEGWIITPNDLYKSVWKKLDELGPRISVSVSSSDQNGV